MNVLVVPDGHYYQTTDGNVYADSVYDYDFFRRYLQAFEHVYVAARIESINQTPERKKLSSGKGVTFFALPPYKGPKQYMYKYFEILRLAKKYCKKCDCAVFRIPSATSNIFCRQYMKTMKPFAVEVVVDPWENFGPRATGNKLMLAVVRYTWTKLVKKMCMKANGASYVTEEYLQHHYPPRAKHDDHAFTASYSSVELPDDLYAEDRKWGADQKTFLISHASNAFTGYGKGHLTLMRAVKSVRDKGYDVRVRFVGDGPKRQEFEDFARSLNIKEYVEFTGRLANGNEVRKVIRNSDLFVLPTFAEGLPRVLLEAMAEGIPCLSSPTCGIPEILRDEFLFGFDDYEGFARGIISFITDSDKLNREGAVNLTKSREYSSTKLNQKRKAFYMQLRAVAEKRKQLK